jgi:hypothetical protein
VTLSIHPLLNYRSTNFPHLLYLMQDLQVMAVKPQWLACRVRSASFPTMPAASSLRTAGPSEWRMFSNLSSALLCTRRSALPVRSEECLLMALFEPQLEPLVRQVQQATGAQLSKVWRKLPMDCDWPWAISFFTINLLVRFLFYSPP